MLPLPSPFARPSTKDFHISQVCSYVVHSEQRVRHLSDWVLGVCVCGVCVHVCTCVHVCVYVCTCVYVHTKGPFLLMNMFLCFFYL